MTPAEDAAAVGPGEVGEAGGAAAGGRRRGVRGAVRRRGGHAAGRRDEDGVVRGRRRRGERVQTDIVPIHCKFYTPKIFLIYTITVDFYPTYV